MAKVGCQAPFCIGFNRKLEKWSVKEFKGDHHHLLVDVIDTQFLRSHRAISNLDKAQVNVMRKVGVKTCQIMDYMVLERHEHVNCTPKDIHNHVDAMHKIELTMMM